MNNIIIVDDEGDGDYQSIQTAVDNSNPGDTIQIYSGMYNETIVIETENITIEGIDHELATGSDDQHPIINGKQAGHIIKINAPYCHIRTCVIQRSGNNILDAGIYIGSSYTTVSSNAIVDNQYGIIVNNCSDNRIENNYILANRMDGIYLVYTEENTISYNIIKENGFQGMFLWETRKNTIQKNTISLNNRDGIQFRNTCMFNIVLENIIHSNGIDGIKMMESDVHSNTIKQNDIYSNAWNGIHLLNGYSNSISHNMIYLNLFNGIHVGDADDNVIVRNTIRENKEEGIVFLFSGSTNNKIYYNNIIEDNAFDSGTNQWDDGENTGGNYWSYYQGSDENHDGLGDSPYEISGNQNKDTAPFMSPLEPPEKPLQPSGSSFGIPGVSYTYNTISSDDQYNRIQYGWDWNGDEHVDEWTDFYTINEICEIPHVWDEEGTYLIKVMAMDNQGFQSEWSDPLSVVMPKHPSNMFHETFLTNIVRKLVWSIQDIITNLV